MRSKLFWLSLLVAVLATNTLNAAIPMKYTIANVPTNIDLRNFNSTALATSPTIHRSGFYSNGDGGDMHYTHSSSACAHPDDGAQVTAIDGGCWIAVFPGGYADIRVWGAKADNSTDVGPFLQKAYNAVGPLGVCVRIPAGIWKMSTGVTIAGYPPCFYGDGWNEAVQTLVLSTSSFEGTWIHIPSSASGTVMFVINTITGQGGARGFSHMAFFEDQPTPTGGAYTPTAYQYIFTLNSNFGRIDFNDLMFYNTTHCIELTRSARYHIEKISGQPLGTCLLFDQQHDIGTIDQVQFWTFWSTDAGVGNYQQANVDPIVFLRTDSPFIDHTFVYGYHSCLEFSQSSDGVTTGMEAGSIQCDASLYSIWIAPTTALVQAQFANVRTSGGAFAAPGGLTGSIGFKDEGIGTSIDIANFECFYANSQCVKITGSGRLSLGNSDIWNFNNDNNGSSGIDAGTTGWVSTANQPLVANPQHGGTVIPTTSAGGTYAIRGTRQNWTPTLKGVTTTGTYTTTYSTGNFWYDGSLVTFTFNISVTSFTGFVGGVAIQGLPFTYNTAVNQNTFCHIASHSGIVLDTGYTEMAGIMPGGGGVNQILLVESGGGVPTQPVPLSAYGSSPIIEGTCAMAAGQ